MNDITFFYKLLEQGFQELFFDAPYYWGVINIKTKRIVTYTEGDIHDTENTIKTMTDLLKESDMHINFLKKMGYSAAVYGEYKHLKLEITG